MLQNKILILFSLLIFSTNASMFALRKRANVAPANLEQEEQRHRAETIEKGQKEYRNLMEAIAHLKNPNLLDFLKFDGPSEQEEEIPRLCGMKLVEKVASLCQNGCQLGYDISSSVCFHGFSDAELIQECCPSTYRNPAIPKNFVF
ncbi:hypothetical protein L5515_002404 [Caenorhabditis briggsae]|uniref:Uncharacterized protein n=1 Tax=Caenorhabditis briggsae TaxID=6238 RepID=A0AAE9J5B4_CAEBR|nr:hypothetical protein L5515_002404 [Caenorhabditis briggsae]